MSQTTTYATCPKCENEIEFEIEYVTADDGEWYQAYMIATELQPDCKCWFTDAELEAIEEKVANDYTEAMMNYEP